MFTLVIISSETVIYTAINVYYTLHSDTYYTLVNNVYYALESGVYCTPSVR